MRRLAYVLQYLGRPPWDTNVTPPELVTCYITDKGLKAGGKPAKGQFKVVFPDSDR